MTNGQDWGQPGQYPQQRGYGQPGPQDQSWRPQQYGPDADPRRGGAPRPPYPPQGQSWPPAGYAQQPDPWQPQYAPGAAQQGNYPQPGQWPQQPSRDYNQFRPPRHPRKRSRSRLYAGLAVLAAITGGGIAYALGTGATVLRGTASPGAGQASPGAGQARAAAAVLLLGGGYDGGELWPVNEVTQATGKPYNLGASFGGGVVSQGVAFARTPHGLTAYVIANGGVVPVNLATRTVGQPIWLGTNQMTSIAASPDGTTVYVTTGTAGEQGTVVPIDTRVNGAGQPIPVGVYPGAIAFAPNGKIAYVENGGNNTVAPINVPAGTAGQPIPLPQGGGSYGQIVFTPDGRTAYVSDRLHITPIDVARGIAGTPIPVLSDSMAITPDGKTLYALGTGFTVMPISTATNTPGASISVRGSELLMSPDGKTLYVLDNDGRLTVVRTATNTPSSPIDSGALTYAHRQMAITPDGKTIYISGYGKEVIPFDTASQIMGKPIKVGIARVAIAP